MEEGGRLVFSAGLRMPLSVSNTQVWEDAGMEEGWWGLVGEEGMILCVVVALC